MHPAPEASTLFLKTRKRITFTEATSYVCRPCPTGTSSREDSEYQLRLLPSGNWAAAQPQPAVLDLPSSLAAPHTSLVWEVNLGAKWQRVSSRISTVSRLYDSTQSPPLCLHPLTSRMRITPPDPPQPVTAASAAAWPTSQCPGKGRSRQSTAEAMPQPQRCPRGANPWGRSSQCPAPATGHRPRTSTPRAPEADQGARGADLCQQTSERHSLLQQLHGGPRNDGLKLVSKCPRRHHGNQLRDSRARKCHNNMRASKTCPTSPGHLL